MAFGSKLERYTRRHDMNAAQLERQALCDLFTEVGPDAPTLCAGWTTKDLAAHLVVRDRRPDAAAGLVIKKLAGYGDRVRLSAKERPWEKLITSVRQGPGRLSPIRLSALDRLTNTIEYFVHLEDVRRAVAGWTPRELPAAVKEQLNQSISKGAGLFARKAPCGLILKTSDGQTVVAKKGEPAVTISGDVGEVILFLYGRQAQARVSLSGPDDLVEMVRNTAFGI